MAMDSLCTLRACQLSLFKNICETPAKDQESFFQCLVFYSSKLPVVTVVCSVAVLINSHFSTRLF